MLKNDIFHHVLFWSILFFILVALDSKEDGLTYIIISELLSVLFLAAIVYINFLVLVPRYLEKKSLSLHLFSLAAVSAVLTPFKSLSLFLISYNFPHRQDFILKNQVFFFLTFFFMGVGSTVYYVMSEWLKDQREKNELQNKTLQSELKFLKSQINPHFLFNTLNNLYALTLKKSDLAPEIVLKLSEMMRYMLYECNERQVSLQKEVNYVKNYLELEKLRQGNKFKIDFEFEGEIHQQKIAPLMFIPFLENSFKHGVNNQLKEGYVDMKLHVKDLKVEVDIENSKAPALPSSSGKKSGGIGLVNVKRRLELLYPKKYELTIMNNPNTYHINLKLDLDI